MRAALVALVAACIATPVAAQDAQNELDALLRTTRADRIAVMRSVCATGEAPASRRRLVNAGFEAWSAAGWCVTVLTRAGRDGTLGYMRDPRSTEPTPAIAFDSGFVGGYLKREALPANAPTMAALLPLADRCLDQKEPRTALCTAAGQMLGARAARGEVISLR